MILIQSNVVNGHLIWKLGKTRGILMIKKNFSLSVLKGKFSITRSMMYKICKGADLQK